jgi:glycosyltransferase involved in cell wall biosynthesis
MSETFLESEVKILSQEFNNIYIFPARSYYSRKWNEKQNLESQRLLPSNTYVVKRKKNQLPDISNLITIGLRLLLKARIKNIHSLKNAIVEILRDTIKSSLFYVLSKDAISAIENRKIYNYWKDPSSIAVCLRYCDSLDKSGAYIRCHGGDLYYDLPNRLVRPYDFFISQYSNIIFPISEHGKKHLIEHGFDSNKLVVSRLGVSIPFQLTEHSSEDTWRIVSCSNVISIKRVWLIAETIALIKNKMKSKKIEWIHFGAGDELDRVHEIIRKYKIEDSVSLRGRVSNSDIYKYYQTNKVDAFINLSISEGVPVSLMEALSFGIPCFATSVGGTPEIIDGDVGCLLSVDIDAVEISDIIIDELLNTNKWLIKRKNARARAEVMCDMNKNYRIHCAIINHNE